MANYSRGPYSAQDPMEYLRMGKRYRAVEAGLGGGGGDPGMVEPGPMLFPAGPFGMAAQLGATAGLEAAPESVRPELGLALAMTGAGAGAARARPFARTRADAPLPALSMESAGPRNLGGVGPMAAERPAYVPPAPLPRTDLPPLPPLSRLPGMSAAPSPAEGWGGTPKGIGTDRLAEMGWDRWKADVAGKKAEDKLGAAWVQLHSRATDSEMADATRRLVGAFERGQLPDRLQTQSVWDVVQPYAPIPSTPGAGGLSNWPGAMSPAAPPPMSRAPMADLLPSVPARPKAKAARAGGGGKK